MLPTHNRADVLPFALRSVLAQTIQDFELLVVGDGCTDGTAEVVADFVDPRIRWFDLPKAPGFGYANRNVALRAARGDLIAFMAHDDLWLPDHLELLAPFFADPRIEIAYSRPLWVAPDGMITPSAFNLRDPAMLEPFLARQDNHIPACCVIHRRACLARDGYWDETLPRNGDWDMWARIIEGGGRANVAYTPVPTGLHFRAIWKTEATAGVFEVPVWKELRQRGRLPATIPAVPVAPGLPEQATTWRALAADPAGWTRALRDDVDQVLDRCIAQAHFLLAIEDKDRHIGNLDALIVLTNQHVAKLDEALGLKDQHIVNIERELVLKDQHIVNLEQGVVLKDQHIANLDGFIADKDRQIADLGRALGLKDQHIANLDQFIARKDEALAEQGRRIAQLERDQAAQDQQMAQHEAARRALAEQGEKLAVDLAASERRAADLAQLLDAAERHIARIERRLPVRLYRRLRRLLPTSSAD